MIDESEISDIPYQNINNNLKFNIYPPSINAIDF